MSDVVERYPQLGTSTSQLRCSFLDHLFETLGFLLALRQKSIKFDRIVAEHLDRPRHFGDLIVAASGDHDVTPTTDDGAHAVRQQGQPRNHVAAYIEPSDQHRAD